MYRDIYWRIVEKSKQPHEQQRTIDYLTEHLRQNLKLNERVLICFLDHEEGNIGWLMEQAARRCGAVPVVWGPDRRWKTLLRLAFSQRVTAIIGAPLVVLGLSKLSKHQGTPLFIRKVITAGYPCLPWMIDGIKNGMDCEAGGCYNLGSSGVVAGFACGRSWGVHLREEDYGVEIAGPDEQPLPADTIGEIVLYPKSAPGLRLHTGENALMTWEPCPCGSKSPRLMEMRPGKTEGDRDLIALGQMLQSWTSILDCRLKKGDYGLEMEVVYFQGEKLPKLPTAAKLVLRPWNPDRDEPFLYEPVLRLLEN